MDVDDKSGEISCDDQGCDCGAEHVETEEVLDAELVQVEINGIFQVSIHSSISFYRRNPKIGRHFTPIASKFSRWKRGH